MAQKWEIGGVKFQPDMPELTDSEIASVPGAKASLGRLDEVQWEVLERLNDKMVIKRDEEKFCSAQPGQIGEQFKNLKDQHAELLLRTQANTSVDDGETAAAPTGSRTGAETGGGGPSSSPALKELESVSKLDETHGIELKVSSEVANVELILCKDASVWVVAAQDKTLAKHVVLGGAGTEQWVPESEAENSIPFKLSDGDKTIVQLDEASFAQEASGISSLSIYKMLLRSEKDKGVVEHKISFLTVERLQNIDAGGDWVRAQDQVPNGFQLRDQQRQGDIQELFPPLLVKPEGFWWHWALDGCVQISLWTYWPNFQNPKAIHLHTPRDVS